MNVQPVAVAGRGGRILSPGELQNNINNKVISSDADLKLPYVCQGLNITLYHY